jgi:DNA polymerase III delta prime subunit
VNRILGQEHAVARLTEAVASGRVHHAWIFSGPRGVGKYTCAIEFARLLLEPPLGDAPEADDDDAPGLFTAPPARNAPPSRIHNPKSEIRNLPDISSHPDLHVIRKEMAKFSDQRELRDRKQINIPIDLLRERMIGGMVNNEFRTAPMALTSVKGRGKVFVIDEAELIDVNGQNALLKSLEEPPRQTYVILVTAHPQRLLPTIHSRCQHVRFGRLNEEAMRAWMAGRSELAALEHSERVWIESFAAGSPGAALLAAEYGFAGWQATLEPMLAALDRGGYPIEMGETLASLIDEFAAAWMKRHENASKDAANKFGAEQAMAIVAAWARARLARAVEAGRDARPAIDAIDLIVAAERQLQHQANLRLVMENLPAQWAVITSEPALATGASST